MLSPISRAVLLAMKLTLPLITGENDIKKQRLAQDSLCMLIKPVEKDMTYKDICIDGIPCAWISPMESYLPPTDKIILYFHGGAYITGTLKYARILASKLASASGINTLTFEYRLSPEFKYPCAVEDALKVYRWLLKTGYNPENIIFAGESAGGNLCLTTTLTLRQRGEPLPNSLICMSPWTDMTGNSESFKINTGIDPTLNPESLLASARNYAGNMSLDDPFISPVFADFSNFPATLIQVGDIEVLLDDSKTLFKQMTKAGVDCELRIFEGMCHVFHILNIPEAKEAINDIANFITERFSKKISF
ncbi:MAG: monooxygenase [Clostridia bacterium]|nr:monooxygenase [Clostridia bacterium]